MTSTARCPLESQLRQRAEAAERDLTSAQAALNADKSKIAAQLEELADLSRDIAALRALREELQSKIAEMAGKLEESGKVLLAEKELSKSARAQVALLNQQTAALRETLAKISAALEASEKRAAEQKVQIASLGKRLNVALVSKVHELSRYRSEFFGRLRDLLGGQKGVRIVGDRFVFQSEVLFPSGSADLNPAGETEMAKLAEALLELQGEIPDEINWVLRVDGHTDNVPVSATSRFADNWELSSARATSVVKFLIAQGVPPQRLVAAGFGEYQPLDPANTDEARARNRRIELKLTER